MKRQHLQPSVLLSRQLDLSELFYCRVTKHGTKYSSPKLMLVVLHFTASVNCSQISQIPLRWKIGRRSGSAIFQWTPPSFLCVTTHPRFALTCVTHISHFQAVAGMKFPGVKCNFGCPPFSVESLDLFLFLFLPLHCLPSLPLMPLNEMKAQCN